MRYSIKIPRWLRGKECTCRFRRLMFNPWKDPLEEEMATHSSFLAWIILWTEAPGRLNSVDRGTWQATVHGVERSRTQLSTHKVQHGDRLSFLSSMVSFKEGLKVPNKVFWRRQWHPTPVLLPGKSHGLEEPGGLQSMGSQRVGHD